ncbi:hypothetical protein [Pseudomarimonas salicorniae]|uniref:Uncharacterized protein n=1 Tax=Pseudomarimonas salicorniae TaxID=2933270 RepID=A0ABT0GC67_9GAMM|nr:hypothetical protein [Lysobacter sp. CAU 1642]MCK7592115.1 hypothetical protein [Lysobacter sp. CAU 1642]
MDKVMTDSATALWQGLIREAEQRRHLSLGEDLEAYLVFALMRHLGDGQLIRRTMAEEYLEAHERPLRPDRLRDVGDRCLLIAGLFPRLAQRRRVNTDYYIDLGRGAYTGVALRAPHIERSLFDRLCEAFCSLVAVLQAIRPEAALEPLPVTDQRLVRRRGLH